MFFKFHAEQYKSRNLIVVPVRGKAPILPGWQKTTLDNMMISPPQGTSGFGILLGKINGIVAIDIDDDGMLNYCPPSPVSKRGSKGETRFFQYNGELSRKYHHLKIEILSCGNQTVLPPSSHPVTGKNYEWTGKKTLLEIQVNELPKIPPSFFRAIEKDSNNKPQTSGALTPGRHNKLIEMAGAKIGEGMLIEEAAQELFEYDQLNHEPPYYTDTTESHGGKGISTAIGMVRSVARTHRERGHDLFNPPPVNLPDVSSLIAKEKKFTKLPKLVGLGQRIFDDIYSTAHIPRTQFTFFSVVNIISMAIGNRVSFRGICPNLYLCIVADSGMGKDHPYRSMKDYIETITPSGGLISPAVMSESGGLSVLEKNRQTLFCYNEAESFFKRISNPSSNQGLREFFTEIFDMPMGKTSGKVVMAGKGKETSEWKTIHNPFVNLYLSLTTSAFERNVKLDMFETGLLSRFLFVFEDRHKVAPFREDQEKFTPSQVGIIELKHIFSINRENLAEQNSEKISQVELSPSDGALEALRQIHDETEKTKKEMRERNSSIDTRFWGTLQRKMIYILKFATIHHAMIHGRSFTSKEVSCKSIEWARDAVSAIHDNMLLFLGTSVSESESEYLTNKIIQWLAKRGEKGASKSALSNNFKKPTKKERDEAIKDLLERGEIYRSKGDNLFRVIKYYSKIT